MIRRIAAAATLTLTLGSLMACQPDIEEGTVTKKDHLDATSKQECKTKKSSSTGKSKRTCKTKKVDECWEITFEDKKGNTDTECVDQSQYDSIKEGDFFKED